MKPDLDIESTLGSTKSLGRRFERIAGFSGRMGSPEIIVCNGNGESFFAFTEVRRQFGVE